MASEEHPSCNYYSPPNLVAQPLETPYRTAGYRYTYRTYVPWEPVPP